MTTLAIDETEDAAADPLTDVAEDNGRMFGGESYSVSRRSRTLGNPDTAAEYWYNTSDVYTFDYFQSVLLFDEYCLDIGIVKLRLDRHLNGNPMCIMAKHVDGRYVYNFEIFHECLLSSPTRPRPATGENATGETRTLAVNPLGTFHIVFEAGRPRNTTPRSPIAPPNPTPR